MLERARTRAAVEREVEKEASEIEAGVRVVGVAVVGSEVVVRAAEGTVAVAKSVAKVLMGSVALGGVGLAVLRSRPKAACA